MTAFLWRSIGESRKGSLLRLMSLFKKMGLLLERSRKEMRRRQKEEE